MKTLREQVRDVGFEQDQSVLFRVVYGKTPGLAGARVMVAHEQRVRQREGKPPDGDPRAREEFFEELDAEIASFEKLAEAHRQRHSELSEGMKDAQMLPTGEELEKIMRYEAALERQFEKRLQQLIDRRRARQAEAVEQPARRGAGRPPGRRGRSSAEAI